MRGVRLTRRAFREIVDLYKWGAPMQDLVDLYGYHKTTIREHLKRMGVQMRPPRAPTIAARKPHPDAKYVKSSRPQIPAGVRVVDESQGPDRLLRSSAHAQRDKRIAERRSDASTGSYPAGASECRYAFLRSGNLLRDLE